MMQETNPFEGRSILDLEAERARLEYQLESMYQQLRTDAVIRLERRLDLLLAEIAATGEIGR